MAYASLAQFKDYVPDNPKVADGSFDALINLILARVDAYIEGRCGRSFAAGTAGEVITFDGNGRRELVFRGIPDIISLSQLRVRDGTNGTWTTLPAGDYFLEPQHRPSGWPAQWIEISDDPTGDVTSFTRGKRTVELTGQRGWAAVPVDIVETELEIAVRVWRARGAGFSDVMGVSTDQIDSLIVTKAVPALGYQILRRYHVPALAAA